VPEEVIRTRRPDGSRAGGFATASTTRVRRRHFPPQEASVPKARRFALGVLGDWGVERRVDDLRLCLSEVATNALLHGGSPAAGFTVCLMWRDGAVLLEVHDDGAGRPARRDPGPEDGHGRGLFLVQALSDAWGVRDEPPGKTVWSLFRVDR
jgi:anti-sigma regulatory factor (Ser/Thr protein kinase)